jgi:hypothetical protein
VLDDLPDMAGKLCFVQFFLWRRKAQIGEYVAAGLPYRDVFGFECWGASGSRHGIGRRMRARCSSASDAAGAELLCLWRNCGSLVLPGREHICRSRVMVTRVKFSELELASDFVSFEGLAEHLAYVRKDTGEILWSSEDLDEEEKLPDDIHDQDKYLAIPSKRDLGLGKSLVFDFARQFLPEDLDQIRRYFSHRGAYGNFKDLLARRRAIEKWHKFEDEAVRRALREWCSENSIELIEDIEGA